MLAKDQLREQSLLTLNALLLFQGTVSRDFKSNIEAAWIAIPGGSSDGFSILQATQLLFFIFPNKSFLLLHMDRVSMPHLQTFAHAKK